jgi:uncharacterized protein YukE
MPDSGAGPADPIPANYDNTKLAIDPASMNSAEQNIQNLVNSISDSVTKISKTLSNLALPWGGYSASWTGYSASMAQQYSDDYKNAVQAVFGTDANPSAGALNVLYGGIGLAADNYNDTENAVMGLFTPFSEGGSKLGAHGPQSVNDLPGSNLADPNGLYHSTSVNEGYAPGSATPPDATED